MGNAFEWTEDPTLLYVTNQKEDTETAENLLVDERVSRLLRGGSFVFPPVYLRCANRILTRPGSRYFSVGFRPLRTLH